MKIAVGDSRFTKKWRNKEMSWEEFCRRANQPAGEEWLADVAKYEQNVLFKRV